LAKIKLYDILGGIMSRKKEKKKKNIFLRIIKFFVIMIFSLCILVGAAFSGVALAMVRTAPELDLNRILILNEPSLLFDDKGELMDEIFSTEKREFVALSDMPDNLINAFISIEDERYYSHNGIDLRRIAGSIYIDVKGILKGRRELHGGSTITQQLLKNTLLGKEVTVRRKVQEMYLAIKLEDTLDKDKILETYLNRINLGGQVYGVQRAAKHYFNKDVSELNLIQSAYIAGVTQWPFLYYAYGPRAQEDPEGTYIRRTKIVLGQMLRNKYIDQETFDQAIDDLNNNLLVFEAGDSERNVYAYNYEWFSIPVINSVREDLKKQYNYSDEEISHLLMYGGLKIYTTMDTNLQNSAQAIVNDDPTLKSVSKGDLGDMENVVQPQAAAVVMDYHTGEVKALIGGRGEQPARSINRAYSTKFARPTASAIKPITVYSPAIDTKYATAATVLEDSPLDPSIGRKWPGADGSPYTVRNSESGAFQGYINIRDSIKRSVNTVAAKLMYEIGLPTGITYAEKFGIHYDEASKTSLSALSLGQYDSGSTPLQMAAAYGVFGNNGMHTEPILYRKVVDKSGKILLETNTVNRKVLSPQSAYLMYDMLKGPVNSGGTGTRARFGSMPAAGKTGTSPNRRDLWFVGLTPYYSGAVWIGDDLKNPLPSNMRSNDSAYIWGKIMAEAHKGLSVKDVQRPSGLTTASVCMDSGLRPTDLCARDQRGSRVYTELFIKGTEPKTLCETHVEIAVNKTNNKIANEHTDPSLIEKRVYIVRDYEPTVKLRDQEYVAPTEVDDSTPSPPPSTGTPSEGNTSGGNRRSPVQIIIDDDLDDDID
jgi:penicillin-binding protein 1A